MEIGKRTRISDNQRDILERFYGRGMVGVGLNYREMIESAVAETGLTARLQSLLRMCQNYKQM